MRPLLLLSLGLALSCGLSGAFGAAATRSAANITAKIDEDPAAESFDHAYRRWAGLLDRHLHGGRLDYAGLKAERDELGAALAELEAVTPEQLAAWPRAKRFAFWINAYNLACVARVVEGYPVRSINDLSRPDEPVWQQPAARLGAHLEGAGTHLSLDQIEHAVIRPRFRDARIHAALNCASLGCPPLAQTPFTAEGLDAQLNAITRTFLADPTRNRFEPASGRVHLSKVFEWFPEDFADEEGGLAGFLNRHAPTSQRGPWLENAEVRYLEWDWSLNDLTDEQRAALGNAR